MSPTVRDLPTPEIELPILLALSPKFDNLFPESTKVFPSCEKGLDWIAISRPRELYLFCNSATLAAVATISERAPTSCALSSDLAELRSPMAAFS